MFCTIINDCQDYDAIGRQSTRVASLLGVNPTFVGVHHELNLVEEFTAAELEAAGCLVDVLDGAEGRKGVVLVNVAHRHGKGKKWPNGTPFGYFWYKETLVVSSIDGLALSLVKKLDIAKEIHVMDVPTVMDYLAEKGVVSKEVAEHVKTTQFRSFDFTPRVGAYLVQGGEVPSEIMSIDEVSDAPLAVWFIDNFGNCKTTLLPEEVGFAADSSMETEVGTLGCYSRLKDVPDRERALMIGSSGIEDKRFLEITVQGAHAAKILGLSVGDMVV
jgi:hypothetical protein